MRACVRARVSVSMSVGACRLLLFDGKLKSFRLSEEIQAILPSLAEVSMAYEGAKSWLNNAEPFLESFHSALHTPNLSLNIEKLKVFPYLS